MTCPTCGSEMRPLFSSVYCPEEGRHWGIVYRRLVEAVAVYLAHASRTSGPASDDGASRPAALSCKQTDATGARDDASGDTRGRRG